MKLNYTHQTTPPMKFMVMGVLGLILLGSQVDALDLTSIGRVESRVGMISNDAGDSNNLVHMERLNWGIQQQLNYMDFNYSLSGGGLLRGSTQLEMTEFIPEFQAKAQFQPFHQTTIEMFSYSQMRNPMQIAQDSLQHKEQVNGLQFRSSLPNNGRLLFAFGFRNSKRDTNTIDHQFAKLHLEQKLLGLQFRFRGEKDLINNDVTSGDNDRSNMSIQWYGSPAKGLNWTAINSVYNYGGNAYWRVYQRVNYQLSNRSTVWAHFNNQQVSYRGSYLNTQAYDVDYRWKKSDAIAFQLLGEGSKVNPLSGDPQYHWRAYLAGLHWRLGDRKSALGVLQFGYKESYRFGSGLDMRFEFEERVPLMQNRKLRVGLSDHSEGEVFIGLDGVSEDPRYDIDHRLDFTVDLWPGQKVQVANTFRLLNHFGTDLDFSEDTLRNAITHNVQLKYVKRKLRASLDHLTVSDLGEESDLRLHLNTRFTYHMSPGSSLNLISMYRYKSEIYPDYLWLNSFIKVNMHYFNWALEVQAQGEPDTIFDDKFSVWMRFVRQL
ncbi:MAG: hypothetical protein HN995_01895 [Candidatus Marinimicrobia bacterium]|jgi:hypothetical protein|nr:hypothetical protein [Candidatus Neomarinimicrobiota bacterium]MBT3576537.1 hypothetical protein [Candidatus Neomarinimicrobiota bacterium]MBT3681324.1 hypothetical protein [Candidatus Neomarinimicrobiota bacterium]MBT3951537.1 hypothetical protein [Candidatus Neomarinimicrobiota bacterium]MBT4253929.1 hypothetical protein [Candidatus Neomarinimicrobiota bacterium]